MHSAGKIGVLPILPVMAGIAAPSAFIGDGVTNYQPFFAGGDGVLRKPTEEMLRLAEASAIADGYIGKINPPETGQMYDGARGTAAISRRFKKPDDVRQAFMYPKPPAATKPLDEEPDLSMIFTRAAAACFREHIRLERLSADTLDKPLAELRRDYLARIDKVKETAAMRARDVPPDPLATFETLTAIDEIKRFILNRMTNFISTVLEFKKGVDALPSFSWSYESIYNYCEKLIFKARSPSNPDMALILEKAMAGEYLSLLDLESRLKQRLKNSMQVRPQAVFDIIRHVHQKPEIGIDEGLLDWLLDIRYKDVRHMEWSIDGRYHTPSQTEREQYEYQPTSYGIIRSIINELGLNENDVFYDLGFGYGRVMFYTAINSNAGKVKGVELVPERVERARATAARLGLKHVELMAENIRNVDISDGTVFFLFNPFNRDTFNIVVKKLREIADYKRIRIVSYGPCTRYFGYERTWLREIPTAREIYGVKIFESF